jgi:hypothetical protein
MGIWTFLRDDVSWAITVVGIVLGIYMFKTGQIEASILMGGITGITALAGRNKVNGQKEGGVSECKK